MENREVTEDKDAHFETELQASFHRGLDLMLDETDEIFK